MSAVQAAENPTEDHLSAKQRGLISLGCQLVLYFARRAATADRHRGTYLALRGLAAIALVLLSLSLTSLVLSSRLTNDRILLAFWPVLLALVPLTFAWRATAYLLESEHSLLQVCASPDAKEQLLTWRDKNSHQKQAVVAAVIAIGWAVPTLWIARQSNVGWFPTLLYTLTVLVAAFLGGLGFYVGAWSPQLTKALRRCQLRLNPISPAETEELRVVAAQYGRIVLEGVAVGVILCSSLLALALRYAALQRRLWILSVVVIAWIAVAWVFSVVHRHLHQVIMSTRRATRASFQDQITKLYATLVGSYPQSALEALGTLLDIDDRIRNGKTYVLNFGLVLQGLASIVAGSIPLALEWLKATLIAGDK